MSALINRVPTGRIISLLAELKYLYWRFKDNPFTLQEMKLDPSLEKTQLDFFPLAVDSPDYGRYNGKYDPYLNNPLDRSGFHLTQSTEQDSQKSKSASECFSALEGLGWIDRTEEGKGKISTLGNKVVLMDYKNSDFLEITQKSLLNYGPFLGFLFECKEKSINGEVKRKDIVIGYTNTGENIQVGGNTIPLSVGSQDDSITRTRSSFVAWAITAGYLWPVGINLPDEIGSQNSALLLLKEKNWPWTKFRVYIPQDLFAVDNKKFIDHPLSYRWMTKSTKALRERGQGQIRGATLQVEVKVKNRRFALVYLLALSAKDNKNLSFSKVVRELAKYPDMFVIDAINFERVMKLELKQMSVTSGIVYVEFGIDKLTPLVGCDLDNLKYGAPKDLIDALDSIYKKI